MMMMVVVVWVVRQVMGYLVADCSGDGVIIDRLIMVGHC